MTDKQHRAVHRERFTWAAWCWQAGARLAFGAVGGAAAATVLARW
jgi:hypothetical protein